MHDIDKLIQSGAQVNVDIDSLKEVASFASTRCVNILERMPRRLVVSFDAKYRTHRQYPKIKGYVRISVLGGKKVNDTPFAWPTLRNHKEIVDFHFEILSPSMHSFGLSLGFKHSLCWKTKQKQILIDD